MIDEVSSWQAGSSIFNKLEANKRYCEIPLYEESMRLTKFITPFGQYQFSRLTYGIHSAQEVFHK